MDKMAKVFGIGLQRTGTTSLAKALQKLGYRVKHGDYSRFPGSLAIDDPIYHRYDAFCDTPYFSLYEKLDLAYPGSKFILTTRNVEEWIASVRSLYEKNDQFHFSSAIRLHHLMIYGTSDFDESLMRHIFCMHEGSVQRYFQDRRNTFLHINIDNSFTWAKLCGFLGVEEPLDEFPFVNRRSDL